jgi:hypothetical protein
MHRPVTGLRRQPFATLPTGDTGWNRHESASKLSAPTAIQGGDAVADERPSGLSDAVADRKRGRSLEDMHETLDASGSGVKEALFSDDLFPLPLSVVVTHDS